MALTEREVKDLQRDLNRFTKRSGLGLSPLKVDGKKGPATKKRIREVKRLLGYGRKKINARVTDDFRKQLRHPRRRVAKTKWASIRVRRGKRRRTARRKHVARNNIKAFFTGGVGSFDGKPVARWWIPKLRWARAHGWDGVLVSGWRDPVYSEHLCYGMCGHPSCPGRCAGRSSNHVGKQPPPNPTGAVDVSDYVEFGRLMARSDCPGPRVHNALGARDPVHFSPSGR